MIIIIYADYCAVSNTMVICGLLSTVSRAYSYNFVWLPSFDHIMTNSSFVLSRI